MPVSNSASTASVAERLPITYGSLAQAVADPLGAIRQQYESHGPISAWEDGGQRVVFVFGPEYNQRVLTDTETFHSWFFPVRGPRGSAQRNLTSGLLNQNGAHHREQRRIVMEPFQRRSFAAYGPRIVEMTEAMLHDWEPGQVRDLHAEMNRLLLRVTSSLLFGFDCPDLAFELGETIERWGEMNHHMGLAAIIPHTSQSFDYDKLLTYAEHVEGKIKQMIQVRRANPHGDDVLSILLRSQASGSGLSDEELIGQTNLLFAAAHLTTAHSLTWTFFLLAQHPAEGDKLTQELMELETSGEFEAFHLEKLAYTDRLLKESLRILPGSAYVQRLCVRPAQLGPFTLSRGTVVLFSQYMTHHMRELYDEPERFSPDRWLTIRPSPFAYLPFGAGPHNCLGGPLATMLMKLVVPLVWRRFRMRVVPHSEINANAVATMLAPLTPVRMQLLRAQEALVRAEVTGNIHRYVDLSASTLEGASNLAT